MKKYWIVGVIVVCSAVSFALRTYTTAERSRVTLEGVKAVCPIVQMSVLWGEDYTGDNIQIGLLAKTHLQTEVEIALRKAGIKIVKLKGSVRKNDSRIDDWYFNSGSWATSDNNFIHITPNGKVQIFDWKDDQPVVNETVLTLPETLTAAGQ